MARQVIDIDNWILTPRQTRVSHRAKQGRRIPNTVSDNSSKQRKSGAMSAYSAGHVATKEN